MMRDNRNKVERTGAISELSSRRNLVGIEAGPDALLGLRLASSLSLANYNTMNLTMAL